MVDQVSKSGGEGDSQVAAGVKSENEFTSVNSKSLWKGSRYIINWRGTFSLWFAKYYFVVLVGKDRRQGTLDATENRRNQAFFASNFLFFLFVLFAYFILFVIFMYFVKQMLGIDIFPNIHWPHYIRDLLGFTRG